MTFYISPNTLDNLMYASVLMPIKMFWFNGGTNKHYYHIKDKVIVITGANAGIGFECALELAAMKPKAIVLACRDRGRGKTAISEIKMAGHFNCEFM